MGFIHAGNFFGGGGFTGISDHPTLAAKLVSHWKMNETSGTRVDSHGGNNLTQYGTNGYATGILGNAFKSQAEGYLLKTSPSGIPTGDVNFSFAFWYYPRSVAVNRAIIYKGTVEWMLQQRSTNEIRLAIRNAANTTWYYVSTTGLTFYTWYHVYVYHNADTDEIGISIDNGTPFTASHSYGMYSSTGNFAVGADTAGGNLGYLQVDSLSVFDDVLTSGEVTDLYNSGDGLDY